MNLREWKDKRARVLREAEQLRGENGAFSSDEDRAAFDAKMREIDEIDATIRKLEAEGNPHLTPAPMRNAEELRAQAQREERERVAEIQRMVRRARVAQSVADTLIEEGTSIDDARARVLDEIATASEARGPQGPSGVQMGEDADDKWRRGVAAWLFSKAGVATMIRQVMKANPEHPDFANLALDPSEFRGLSLMELARESLQRRNVSVRGLDKMRIVDLAVRAPGANTTSDFVVALENVLHKTLLAAYSLMPDTWRRFCATGSVSDFRAHPRYRTGYLGRLSKLGQSSEYTNKAIPDAVKEAIAADTYGNILSLSRQAIINDDMGVFSRVAVQLGRAAALSIELGVYDLLVENGGLGPLMGDGNPLFDASHNNIGTGSDLTVSGIDGDRVVMATQMDPSGNEFLDLRPAALVLPIGLGGHARVINEAEFDTDRVNATTTNRFLVPNKVRGLFREIVDTPHLEGTRRYLFADPGMMPVIEVAFLDGVQEPFLEMREGWRTDGVEWKERHDFGIAAVETRGAVTNAGTP